MNVLLLAAGLGTRLRPLTDSIPKCLVPIHGTPLMDYWFHLLLAPGTGIERILVNTSYLAEQVQAHVKSSPWADRVDLTHETQLLGTGGTVLANRDYFGRAPFLVAHGDNLTDFNVAEFIARHRQRPPQAAITMMTFRTDTPSTCGIVELDDLGLVVKFHEKVANPPGNQANAAAYIFEPEVLDFLVSLGRPVIDLSTEVIPAFMGRIYTYPTTGYLRDIGNMDSLNKAQIEFPKPDFAGNTGALP